MTMNMLQRSSLYLLRHLILQSKTISSCATVSFCTNSSGNQDQTKEEVEAEDFFGIPSDFKLQQTRVEQIDIEKQYFGNCLREDSSSSESFIPHDDVSHKRQFPDRTLEERYEMSEKVEPQSDFSGNLFDEQYFEGALEIENQKPRSRSRAAPISHQQATSKCASPASSDASQLSGFNYIDDQYWGNHQEGGESDIHSLSNVYGLSDEIRHSQDGLPHRNDLNISRAEERLLKGSYDNTNTKQVKSKNHHSRNNYNSSALKLKDPQSQQEQRRQQSYVQGPVTAHDVAVKIRRELKNSRETAFNAADRFSTDLNLTSNFETDGNAKDFETGRKRDSKGFRVLSDQLLDLDKMTTSDIVLMLRRKILFDHEDFLAIDKPYGLPSHDNNNERITLTKLLPRLCNILPPKYKVSNLHLVQGLDRDVTGAVILAKNEESAYLLRGMFSANEITQRFWAITKGVPDPRAGVIDIPIGEAKVGDIYKMVLRPLYSKEPNFRRRTSKSQSCEAITEYRVLASHQEAALVECQPLSKLVRHQIRVHLSSGLNVPILGDHKYSHFSKLAPQKLNRSTLELLHVRQAKVRHLALHLHCHTLVLPSYKSRTIFIPTKLPPHFFKNMKSLKLSLK